MSRPRERDFIKEFDQLGLAVRARVFQNALKMRSRRGQGDVETRGGLSEASSQEKLGGDPLFSGS